MNAVQEDARKIFVTTPKINTELREAAVRQSASLAESAKKRLRGLRQEVLDACKDMVKDKDVLRQGERELKSIVEEATGRLEKVFAAKQKELMNQ